MPYVVTVLQRLRSFFLFLSLGVLLCSCVSTGKRTFALSHLPKDSIRLKPVDLEAYKKTYADYDGVYLMREYVVEHAQRPYVGGQYSWDIYKIGTLRYVVLNPDAEWLTTFKLDVEKGEELKNAFITVIAPDGSVRQFDKGDLREEVDSDGDRVYKLAYPGIVEGSIVDEGYEIHYDPNYKPEVRHQIPLQFAIPCERLSVRYAYPDEWTIKTRKSADGSPVLFRTLSEPERDLLVLAYDNTDIAAVPREIYSPYLKEFADYLDLSLAEYKIGSYTHSTVPESWKEYAESYRSYALEKGSPQSRAIGKQVEKIVEKSDSPMQKMKKIVAWVQKEIVVDWDQPNRHFRDLLQSKRGKPYLICGVTRAMLENAGITSSLVLIHSAEEGPFDSTYLHWGAFYQAGVTAQIDGKTFYLFPWIKNYPVEQVPVYFQGQPALVITDEGYGGFETVPYGSIAGNRIQSGYDVEIDEEGVMRVAETREFYGEAAYELRRTFEGLNEEKLEKEIRDMLSYEGGEVKLEKYELEKRDDYSQPLVVRMTYTIDNLVTVTPDEAIVRSEGLFSPAARTGYKLDTLKRRTPIRIYNDEQYLKRVSVRVPAGWRLIETPKPVSEKNRFGEISASYSYAEGVLTVEHTRRLQRSDGTAAEAGELQAIVGKRSKLNVPTLIFRVE